MENIISKIQTLWDKLPKEAKVGVYMIGAALLDQLTTDLKPEMLSFIPVAYRLMIFNLLEVLIVETAKRLKALCVKR